VKELRDKLKGKNGDAISDKELEDLDKALEKLEKATSGDDAVADDELKAEIERLREQIDKYEDTKGAKSKATPVQEKGLDIDTQMPFGDLEPFGREDTAQELTENSVRESDEMVDQLERAEVAEEKRAVFRALTRLRGAAITSFDGVARSQTGNIDEYNKVNKWRRTHPIHHLADEESDVSKWAFPVNADLMQSEVTADLLQVPHKKPTVQTAAKPEAKEAKEAPKKAAKAKEATTKAASKDAKVPEIQYDDKKFGKDWHKEWKNGDFPSYKKTYSKDTFPGRKAVVAAEDVQSDGKPGVAGLSGPHVGAYLKHAKDGKIDR